MVRPAKTRVADTRIKMYVRVEPETRRAFKAVANLMGDTLERRLERLMKNDITQHLSGQATSAAS